MEVVSEDYLSQTNGYGFNRLLKYICTKALCCCKHNALVQIY